MAADLRAELTARFINAIRKSFKPCPLIGDKWFAFEPGPPPAFRFRGTSRLAKATAKSPEMVAKILVKNLDLKGLGADVRVTGTHEIRVALKSPGSGKKPPDKAPQASQ